MTSFLLDTYAKEILRVNLKFSAQSGISQSGSHVQLHEDIQCSGLIPTPVS